MTLRLVIEHSAHPQRSTEWRHEAGDLSIGRGAECDWQLDDPDQYMSRRHCVISGQDGQFTVTDASRGGLFIDGKDTALGAGAAAILENGTRLRLGDVVIRVELSGAARDAPNRQAAPLPAGFGTDDFFAARPPAPPAPPRPQGLPQPFERAPTPFAPPVAEARPAPPQFDDPFSMDPVATPAAPDARPPAQAATLNDFSFDFGPSPMPAAQMNDQSPARAAPAEPWAAEPLQALPPLSEPPAPEPASDPARMRERAPAPPADPPPSVATLPTPPPLVLAPAASATPEPMATQPQIGQARPGPNDEQMMAAFFRGLGIEAPAGRNADPLAEMEAFGARFRLLAEGLVQLLRTRAREKSSVRVAQTVIGAADVNPLKFLPGTDEAIAALVAPRGKGYLGPDEAIGAAFRDLSDHQMRTWTALQSALRQMIDRFDPAAFEADIQAVGLVKSLISGSQSARLWQLYTERYRDIAKSAEERFLGDVGADFRDAYEGNRRTEK